MSASSSPRSNLRQTTREVPLSGPQLRFRRSEATYRALVGGRGAGKTRVGAHDLLMRARPGRTYLVGSPTGPMMWDTTYPTFKERAQELNRWDSVRLTPYPNVTLTTGATVRFRTAEDPDRMRGPNLSGIWLDEASLMSEEAFHICIASLREAGEQGWLSATFTPKGLSHWTCKLFGMGRPDVETFYAPTKTNLWLPPGFVHRLEQQYGEKGLRSQQELEGLFVCMEGAEWPPEYFPESIWFTDWPKLSWVTSAMALDPSKGKDRHKPKEGREPDYSALVWGAVSAEPPGHVWIDADLDNVRDANFIVQDTLAHYHAFTPRPRAVVVETNQFQELFGNLFFTATKERNVAAVPLYGYTHTAGENKELRIRGIGPYLARRELHFRDTPGARLLVAQLRDFPAGAYDDGPDALELLLQMLLFLIAGQGEMGWKPKLLRP